MPDFNDWNDVAGLLANGDEQGVGPGELPQLNNDNDFPPLVPGFHPNPQPLPPGNPWSNAPPAWIRALIGGFGNDFYDGST